MMHRFMFSLFGTLIAPTLLFAAIIEDSDPDSGNDTLLSAQVINPGDFDPTVTVESNFDNGLPDFADGDNEGSEDFYSFTGVSGTLIGTFTGVFATPGYQEMFVLGFWVDSGSGFTLFDINTLDLSEDLLIGSPGDPTLFAFQVTGLVATSTYAIGITMFVDGDTPDANDDGFFVDDSPPFEETAYTLSLNGPTASPLTTPEPSGILMFAGSGIALILAVRRRLTR